MKRRLQIHIKAGENLLITNTFAANEASLNMETEQVEACIRNGVAIAKEAVAEREELSQEVFVAGGIGTIPEHPLHIYYICSVKRR